MRSLWVLLFLLFLLLPPTLVTAAPPPGPPVIDLTTEEALGLATKWIAEGTPDKAASLLRLLEQAAPDDPQVVFLAAQVAVLRGDHAGAIERLRRLLGRDPSLARVRLELARALFLDRQYEAARYHFEIALGEPGLPPAVRDNVYDYLQAIAAQTTWVSLTATIGPDSNPNNATQLEVIDVRGVPFVVNRNAQAQSATGLNLVGQARQAFGEGNQSFARAYTEYRDFPGRYADFAYLQGTLGRNFLVDRSVWTVEAGPLGAEYQRRLLYRGGTLQVSHASPLAPRWLASQFANYRRLSYVEFDYLSGHQIIGGGSVRYAIDGKSAAWTTLTAGRLHAEDAAYSYRMGGLLLGYSTELPRRINVEMRASGTEFRYDEPTALFDETRHDRLLQFEVDLTARDYSWRGFAPRVTIGWARNTSTIDLYAYRRVYGGVGVTRAF